MPLAFMTSLFRLPPLPQARSAAPRMSAMPRLSAPMRKGLGVVITGSTRGVGRALAEAFLEQHDSVVVTSRDEARVQDAIIAIRRRMPDARVFGYVCDVRNHEDVARLTTFASDALGVVNAFICNAGVVGTRGKLADVSADDVQSVVQTNLIGPMFCAKEALRIAPLQQEPLHVFLMDGSGTRGNATADYAAYGCAKRAIPQLVSSLAIEAKGTNVRFHNLSPGMVLTDLLLGGKPSHAALRVFNFLADEPDTVATTLVPQIRTVVASDRSQTYVAYLTVPKAVYRLLTGFLLGFRRNMFFDQNGRRIDTTRKYNENGVRLRE